MTTSSGGAGLPLGAAVGVSSLSNSQTISVPGVNGPHILKSTAADFATTVHNHIRDACRSDGEGAVVGFCRCTFSFSKDPVHFVNDVDIPAGMNSEAYVINNKICMKTGVTPLSH